MKSERYPHEPHSEAWELAADRQARSFAPNVIACNDCGAPNIKGYCCWFCGSTSPESE